MISGATWTVRLDFKGLSIERKFSSSIIRDAFVGRAATIEITLDEMESEIQSALRGAGKEGR